MIAPLDEHNATLTMNALRAAAAAVINSHAAAAINAAADELARLLAADPDEHALMTVATYQAIIGYVANNHHAAKALSVLVTGQPSVAAAHAEAVKGYSVAFALLHL